MHEELIINGIFPLFFSSHGNIDTTAMALSSQALIQQNVLDSLSFHENEVLGVFQNLDTTTATGPDGVSTKLLKEVAPGIAKPLTLLFNMSLDQIKFPCTRKRANLTPIHKKGSEHYCNYRPISLLSCICTIMQKRVSKHVFNFLKI